MKMSFSRVLNVALLVALIILGLVGRADASSISFEMIRQSADPEAPTFSGSGSLVFDPSAPNGISAFSMTLETIGGNFGGPVEEPVSRTFEYTLDDILGTSGLEFGGEGSKGFIVLQYMFSNDGLVEMGKFELDFSRALASGFCYSASDIFGSCIFGGGSSTVVEADLVVASIPVPASLYQALGAIFLLFGASGGLRRAARRRVRYL